LPGGLDVAIEGIRVLHRELAPAHHAETRPALVAELGLDVIEIFRQRPVAAQLLARDVGDDLFAGRLDDEVAVVPVFHPQQLGPVLLEAAPTPATARPAEPPASGARLRPARFISSRMMFSTLRMHAQPIGM
jgi:hypothetical protein